MNKTNRQEYIQQELEAIYEEFSTYIEQLTILKPFLKDLVAVANGAEPSYKLNKITKNCK